MQDFDSYSQGRRSAANGKTKDPRQGGAQKQDADAFAETARRMAGAFGGKGEEEILRAIYKEAERGRRAASRPGFPSFSSHCNRRLFALSAH